MLQNDPAAEDDEMPSLMVSLSEFFVARTELTRSQWSAITGTSRPAADEAALPQHHVSWTTVAAMLRRWGMDLPTEAQWEYACRAGTNTPWSFGVTAAAAPEHAWFAPAPGPVGRLLANAFGLHDMHGNVAEWCLEPAYDYGTVTAASGDGHWVARLPFRREDRPARAVRGGTCADGPLGARSSARRELDQDSARPLVGVRPIRRVRR
jgi:formylglycine-generating enzyme required for sulfatase activity